jgi:RimJ/RimL family protein N-acetyltransferase
MATRMAWVDAADMASLLRRANGAIVSCSGVAIEAIAMECPIVGVCWCDNQVNHAQSLEAQGIPIVRSTASASTDNTATARSAVRTLLAGEARMGDGTLDAYGAFRVAGHLSKFASTNVKDLSQLKKLHMLNNMLNNMLGDVQKCTTKPPVAMLRPATFLDARRLLEWRNDPRTRSGSLSTETILWKDHVAWFARVMMTPSRTVYVLEVNGVACGSGRLDDEEHNEVELSWTIAPHARGLGLSYILGETLLAAVTVGKTAVAVVKIDNIGSLKVVHSLGMVKVGKVDNNVAKFAVKV